MNVLPVYAIELGVSLHRVSTVHAWVARRTNAAPASFALASSFPRTVYAGEKAHLSLTDAKLTPRAALYVQDL